MTSKPYKSRSGQNLFRPTPTESEYRDLTWNGNPGFCLACGLNCDGVEPDARKYPCESCGEPKVYGLEELLMMGLLTFSEGVSR